MLAEVGRLVEPIITAARRKYGRIIGVAEPQWWSATDDVKLTSVATLALAWLVHDPERMVRERLRQMSWDLCAATDWTATSRRSSHAVLGWRRAEPGPRLHWFDPIRAERWVRTGSSEGGVA